MKFVFATTELRKVPITVLSRCQRFDLRRVRIAELAGHYGRVAQQEGVIIEPAALDQIARAADGSVRDGLSILDQAIAQANTGFDAAPGAEAQITAAQVADMLGLGDRERVFDLMEAVMGGKPAIALAIADAAFERGADLGILLQDLLDLLHTVTRIKSIPALRESHDLPEVERIRGGHIADGLTVPVLARAWQMLLKGVGEVEIAPDRRAAAEMVLIRLCYVADLPTPGDLVRRLASGSGGAGSAQSASNGSVARALANEIPLGGPVSAGPSASSAQMMVSPAGGALMSGVPRERPQRDSVAVARASLPAPDPVVPSGPRFVTFRDVIAFVADRKEAMLHAHLLHSVHLVRFAPPVIELRPQAEAPRDLAARLAALLSEVSGTRWTIALSTASGDLTLAEQGSAADMARRTAAADHPLVRAILDTFPGARIDTVHDRTTDAYGLPAALTAEPDMPDFAPPDAEYFDEDPMEIDP